jgi:uncharacterized membrane protein
MIAFLCHRLPERSFLWLWDPPWLCARCTGFYTAILIGACVVLLCSKASGFRLRWGIGLATVSLVAIGLEKLLGADVGNGIRCLTALPLGFVVGAGLVIPLHTLVYKKNTEKI